MDPKEKCAQSKIFTLILGQHSSKKVTCLYFCFFSSQVLERNTKMIFNFQRIKFISNINIGYRQLNFNKFNCGYYPSSYIAWQNLPFHLFSSILIFSIYLILYVSIYCDFYVLYFSMWFTIFIQRSDSKMLWLYLLRSVWWKSLIIVKVRCSRIDDRR